MEECIETEQGDNLMVNEPIERGIYLHQIHAEVFAFPVGFLHLRR